MEPIFSAVRLWEGARQRPVGVGFVAGQMHVITCAHVVADALGDSKLALVARPPADAIVVDFPALATPTGKDTRSAIVVGWSPMYGEAPDDVAVLRVESAVSPAIRSVEIGAQYALDDRVLAYGVGDHLPDGRFVEAKVIARLPGPLIQITSDNLDLALRKGCSGAAAWNLTRGGVVGMVSAGQLQLSGLLTPIGPIADLYAAATGELLASSAPVAPAFPDPTDAETHILVATIRRLPCGPAVEQYLVSHELIEAFASATNKPLAEGTVARACQLVLEALLPKVPSSKYRYVINSAALPNPDKSGMVDYWAEVFANACMLGPRMMGALLLAAPPVVVDGARTEIVKLFAKLM